MREIFDFYRLHWGEASEHWRTFFGGMHRESLQGWGEFLVSRVLPDLRGQKKTLTYTGERLLFTQLNGR